GPTPTSEHFAWGEFLLLWCDFTGFHQIGDHRIVMSQQVEPHVAKRINAAVTDVADSSRVRTADQDRESRAHAFTVSSGLAGFPHSTVRQPYTVHDAVLCHI